MSRKTIAVILSPADRERARPVLDALERRGFRPLEERGGKTAALLFLSSAFAADEQAQEALFAADTAGREIIPVDLDGAAQPELVRAALIAKNAIAAQGRTPDEIAGRVASAPAFQKTPPPRWLPRLLIAAAAVLILGAAAWLWRAGTLKASTANDTAVLAMAEQRYGLSAEDLANIAYVYLIGDTLYHYTEEEAQSFSWNFFTHSMEEDGMHYYSTEDGRRLTGASYSAQDLEILRMMPRLTGLDLFLIDAEALPDLSGLGSLSWIEMADCGFTDLSGLAGSTLGYIGIYRCPIEDYSVFSRCEQLTAVSMEFDYLEKADLSGFSPPALEYASFAHGREPLKPDLSGLRNCPKLETLEIRYFPLLDDLAFLEGLENLTRLELEELPALREIPSLGSMNKLESLSMIELSVSDISGVRELGALKDLTIESCPNIRDFSPIGGCTAMERFHIWGCYQFSNAAFLASLPELRQLELHNAALPDLNFLNALPADRELSLAFSGPIRDYSALGHFRSYDWLHVNPNSGNAAPALAALEGVSVRHLHLHECRGLDLAALPEVTEDLEIWYGDLRELSAMPKLSIDRLQLYDLPYLTSLNGIENLTAFSRRVRDGLVLTVTGCARLKDWSALEGKRLDALELEHVYSLPALEKTDFAALRLEGVDALEDLHFLDARPDGWHYYEIGLTDMENIRDLSPLRRLRGEKLTVPPQLGEQAEELVGLGAVGEFEIAYPEGAWESYDGEQRLLSLDELDTLPAALLRSVRRLWLAGDALPDPDRFEIQRRENEDGSFSCVLVDHDTDEETALEPGTLTALPDLSALEGLRELRIWCQGLRELEGIQSLDALESFTAADCAALEDVSALFTLQELRRVEISLCPVSSLQGVQNLTALEEIELRGTALTDLTPLLELPALRRAVVSADMEQAVHSLDGKDFDFELIVEQPD